MDEQKHIHILSLGAGVQSSTLALMAAKGEVGPMPTAAIFADTQAEPASVYKWLDWLETQLPFPVIRVTAGSLTERITTTRTNRKTGNVYYSNMIPAMVLNQDGTKGIVGRACTSTFKIEPILKAARKIGGVKRGQKHVSVIQWIGISIDEVTRMKPSREKWSEHRWPLIEIGMKRHDCLNWMRKNGYPQPPVLRVFIARFILTLNGVVCATKSPMSLAKLSRSKGKCSAFTIALQQQGSLRGCHFFTPLLCRWIRSISAQMRTTASNCFLITNAKACVGSNQFNQSFN